VVAGLVAYLLQSSRHAAKHPLYSILAACKAQVVLLSTMYTCSTTIIIPYDICLTHIILFYLLFF
jgi:hypothetical protein